MFFLLRLLSGALLKERDPYVTQIWKGSGEISVLVAIETSSSKIILDSVLNQQPAEKKKKKKEKSIWRPFWAHVAKYILVQKPLKVCVIYALTGLKN